MWFLEGKTKNEKNFVFSLFVSAVNVFAMGAFVQEANAIRNDRIVVCDWYRTQAQIATRRGNHAKAERYWYLHQECLANRID